MMGEGRLAIERALEERDALARRVAALEAKVDKLQRVALMAARFYTFGHGGYRWEATDERRDALYDALRAVGYGDPA